AAGGAARGPSRRPPPDARGDRGPWGGRRRRGGRCTRADARRRRPDGAGPDRARRVPRGARARVRAPGIEPDRGPPGAHRRGLPTARRLVTPTAATIIIFSSTLFPFLFAAARVGAYLILGTLFFGVALGNANLPAALFILALSTACFTAMGMLSAAWVMVFKKGDPAGWI